MENKGNQENLRTVARAADPDRYLASLFERDEEKRRALWALIAFNGEIARVRETVSEAQRGLIRLQWWRDTLTAIAAGQTPPGPALVADLAVAMHRYGLPRAGLEALIVAREFDLEDTAPGNLQGLENYADLTTTPLLALMEQVLKHAPHSGLRRRPEAHDSEWVPGTSPRTCEEEEPEDTTFLRYLGVAYALTGLLRAVPFFAAQRRCYLPEDLLLRAGLLPDRLYGGEALPSLPDVVREVAQLARGHLDHTRGTLPHPVFRAMAALTALYLRQMEQAGYDVFSPRLRTPPKFRELRVALSVAVSAPRTGT